VRIIACIEAPEVIEKILAHGPAPRAHGAALTTRSWSGSRTGSVSATGVPACALVHVAQALAFRRLVDNLSFQTITVTKAAGRERS
jgi:hypothetical protein